VDKLKQNSRGIGSYFVFIGLLVLIMFALNYMKRPDNNYTQAQLVEDLTAGKVKEIYISPNKEAPTGYATIVFNDNAVKELYATDIRTLETVIRENGK